MRRIYFFIVLGLMAFVACTEPTKKEPVAEKANAKADYTIATSHDAFKNVAFDAKRDFICGMPITAGVTDTAHYNNKVYGFCSKECKDEFMKHPTSYVAAVSK